ncbi:head GIN domain-containing protein [Hymenobacter sp. GOD-10R]|uniref:head GIN domain-containing protein n=1 Tax=Hymenobacter sp. GOD-10R TaxID=3093922 RepID=UPI002D792D22|nr:head GIN domain-containing protein [Hymenobacter sp. GOD-10R]WRQ30542.1 head GIN domain-containing protein [Hymenobacter sp. GOD-10R]
MKTQGSGTMAVQQQPVSSFTRLHLSVRGTVELHQGAEEKVVVEADDNLLDYVQVVNSGRTLYVTSENKLRAPAFTDLRVQVYLRQIDELYIASQGAVICATPLVSTEALTVKVYSQGNTALRVVAPTLTLTAASQGNLSVAGQAGEAVIKLASEGNFDGRDLCAQHLRLRNMSEGNIDLYAEQTISLTHLGQGYIHYAGPARLADVRQYGAGEICHVA